MTTSRIEIIFLNRTSPYIIPISPKTNLPLSCPKNIIYNIVKPKRDIAFCFESPSKKLKSIELSLDSPETNCGKICKHCGLTGHVQKRTYLKEFDAQKNGDLHDQQWVKDEMKNFYKNMDNLQQFYCSNCTELWPRDLPDTVKSLFEILTMIEEMLIAPIIPIMSVYRLSSGALASRGFCANFYQNINEIINELPRLPKDLPIIILKKKNQLNQLKHFIVNRKRVELCLKYLYEKINDISLESDGPAIFENELVICENDDVNVFIENNSNEVLQEDKIKNAINFPKNIGDPTLKSRLKEVTETLGFKHLLKCVTKHSNGFNYYHFAQHPRFKFWAYDRIRRHRSLDQCKVFMKQNPNEANLTIEDLKNLLKTGESEQFMKKLSAYSSNITGSDPYWWHRYEWQSRSAIHAHGAVTFKNDPNLIELTTKVYAGRLASKKINDPNYLIESDVEHSRLLLLIKEGEDAEKIVLTYTNTLVTAMNPRISFDEAIVPEPHPCSLNTNKIPVNEFESDYENLINCCQRHVCRKSSLAKNLGKCRFKYSFSLQNETKIEFVESDNSVRAEILVLRNDPYMNMHNRLICHHWRGNVDMQIILDKSAAINYMTASDDVLECVSFTNELSKQFKEARNDLDPIIEPDIYKDDWMELSEIRLSFIGEDAENKIADMNYDFLKHRLNYTLDELCEFEND
ncbi:unnamed protein product [Brachionus calyciflorus]|uniref:DUF6570 domain-containing protein n=1 Tax=Brachionus calyciflorus TaxID=104777 RepID=A0A814DAA0_9BILA|nr:unnamed protein product [Brachionus calyciflorus]